MHSSYPSPHNLWLILLLLLCSEILQVTQSFWMSVQFSYISHKFYYRFTGVSYSFHVTYTHCSVTEFTLDTGMWIDHRPVVYPSSYLATPWPGVKNLWSPPLVLTIRHQKGKHSLTICFMGSPPIPTPVDSIALKEDEET